MTTPVRRPAAAPCAAILAFAVALAGCGATPSASPPASATPSAIPLQSAPTASSSPISDDLDGLLAALERSHPDPFHGVPRDEFVAALDAYATGLPSMTTDESVVELMRVWAMLSREGRDGHQFVLPRDAPSLLPIRVYEFAEGLFVTAALANPEELVGSRLTAIDGTPIDQVLAAIEPLVPRDGPATVPAFRPIFLLRTDVLRGLGIIGSGAVRLGIERDAVPTEVTVEPVSSEEHAARLGAYGPQQLPPDDRVRYLAAPSPFAAELLEDGIAYLRYRSVIAVDVEEVRGWVGQDAVVRLVLDLRQNPGGDNTTFLDLLALVESFAEEHPGSVTVLTDRVTFSAAANLATEIEARTDATFVGEAMGGGLNFWDDVGWVDLDALPVPMRAAVSLRYWEFAAADDPRLTIEPDVVVPVTAADFFSGRDPALEVALRGED